MAVLVLDTCLGACTALLGSPAGVVAARSEPMARGHQERLAPMVQETMAQADLAFADLDRIAVTVGPGSFTGLRVGLSFAKAMALALGKPCVGLTSLEALAASAPGQGRLIACADARRGRVYWQGFEDGMALAGPAIADIAELAAFQADRIVGPGADLLEQTHPAAERFPLPAATPEGLAKLALDVGARPAQALYLRAPDAKLPGGIDPW